MIRAGWLTPSEFWQMHPQELFWFLEAKLKKEDNEEYENVYDYLDLWMTNEQKRLDGEKVSE